MYLTAFVLLESTPALPMPNLLEAFGRMAGALIAFVFVAFLAYYVTKLIANARFSAGAGRNIQVLEQVAISSQSTIQLVRAGERYLLIGVTKESINTLCEIPKEEITLKEPGENPVGVSFGKFFSGRFSAKGFSSDRKSFDNVLSRAIAKFQPTEPPGDSGTVCTKEVVEVEEDAQKKIQD